MTNEAVNVSSLMDSVRHAPAAASVHARTVVVSAAATAVIAELNKISHRSQKCLLRESNFYGDGRSPRRLWLI